MIIFKNMLSFALTAKAYDWFIIAGVEDTMIPISIVQVAVCLLTVPMCKSKPRDLDLVQASLSLRAFYLSVQTTNTPSDRYLWQALSFFLRSPRCLGNVPIAIRRTLEWSCRQDYFSFCCNYSRMIYMGFFFRIMIGIRGTRFPSFIFFSPKGHDKLIVDYLP